MRSRFLLSLAAIALLAACKGGDNQQQSARTACPAGQLCLEAGNGAEPNSLDPHKTQGTWESRIVSDLMVGLTDNDAAGNVIPGMATSWETSADGLVWTFHLRQANWSDGQPVTSEDFVYALRRILTPATAAEYASLLYFIKGAEPVNGGKAAPETLGVRALGPQTLEITLEHPAPYILELAKHQTMYPVPKHVVEKWGDKWTDPAHYVSNGPYKLTYWKLGDKVTAVKNASYWGASEVCIDRVNYYPTEDRPSAERQVKRGELDMHSPIPPNRIPYLRKKDQLPDYVHSHTYLGVAYLPVNTSNPVMRDKRVRLALTMAIDREFIVKGILMDTGFEAAFNFVPPGVANYTSPPPPVWSTWPLERRQQEARRLLAEAGYGPNKPLRFEVKHRAIDTNSVNSSLQSDWRKIGVEATMVGAETQIAYQAYRMRDFQIGDAGWIADYNDAMSFLYLMQSKTGAMNYGDYNNPRYDELLALADNEPDVKKRADYLAEAERIMVDDVPAIILYYQPNTNLVNPRVTGFVDNIGDQHPTRFMSFAGQKCAAPAAPAVAH